jgi:hypothetical protein
MSSRVEHIVITRSRCTVSFVCDAFFATNTAVGTSLATLADAAPFTCVCTSRGIDSDMPEWSPAHNGEHPEDHPHESNDQQSKGDVRLP